MMELIAEDELYVHQETIIWHTRVVQTSFSRKRHLKPLSKGEALSKSKITMFLDIEEF